MRVGNVYLHLADVKETHGDRTGAIVDFTKCMEIWEVSGKLHKKYLLADDEQEMYARLLAIMNQEDRCGVVDHPQDAADDIHRTSLQQ